MKGAVVSPAGGFIAGHLVKKLKREGYWVCGADCPTLTELSPPPPGKTGWSWAEESRRRDLRLLLLRQLYGELGIPEAVCDRAVGQGA